MPRNIFVIVGLCVWFGLFSACKQEVKEIPQDITRPDTDTNINPKEFDQSDNEPDRVIWQKPEMVMELLGDMKDKVVADIGAGTGFFTFRLLQQAKKVIAVDIDKGPLERMRMFSKAGYLLFSRNWKLNLQNLQILNSSLKASISFFYPTLICIFRTERPICAI